MSRQSITKAQKPKDSALLSPTDLLQRKTINRTDFGASIVDTRSPSGQQIDKSSLQNLESQFNHDFTKIPVRINSSFPIQAKLKIGQPNDKYEQEADRVAEQVMRMPEPRLSSLVFDSSAHKSNTPSSGKIQRACASCLKDHKAVENESRLSLDEELIQTKQITPLVQHQESLEEGEEDELIQAKTTGALIPEVTPAISSGIQSLQGGGQPLPETARTFFEPRFDKDFSQVRVHAGPQASTAAQNINARAFTIGQNVVFGKAQYAPETLSGKHLLAHELTHVVQQGKIGSPSSIQAKTIGVKDVNGVAIQLKEKQPYKAIILSPDEILADSDPQRAATYQRTGMPPVRLCKEPKDPRDKKNCPFALTPGTPVTVIGGNEATWAHIEHPPISELGGQKFGWVIGAFIKENTQPKAKRTTSEGDSPVQPEAQEISVQKIGSIGEGRKLKKQTEFSLPFSFSAFSPSNLVGNSWLRLPDSLKLRLVDLAIDANLTLVDQFPGKFALGDLWIFMKAGLIGFFEKLKLASQTTKIQVTNRLAKIISGQSLDYSLGLLKGMLKGFFIDGLLGIFIAIGELIKGLRHLWSFFEKVGQLIGGFPDEIAKLIQGFRSFGHDSVSNIKPALEELKKVIFDPDQGKKLVSIIVEKGKSFTKEAGQKIAGSLLTFFSKPGSEKKTGELIGRGVGMVLFEVIFAILTAGGGAAVTAVKTGAKVLAKIGVKIVGSVLKVFKKVHNLFGFVANVVKQGTAFVKGKILSKLTGKLHDLLKQVQKLITRFLKNCHESKLVCNFAKGSAKFHTNVLKRSAVLRKEAREVYFKIYPRMKGKIIQVHHRIPLEWRRILPRVDPNRISNLQGLTKIGHQRKATDLWTAFRNTYRHLGRNPTSREVIEFAMVVDRSLNLPHPL